MEAWVTLATNDTYALGAMVLGRSLRRVKTSKKLVVMITPGVSNGVRESLSRIFDAQVLVDPYDSGDEANLALIGRPDLGITFTKLHCWRLTPYKKCVFMDADTMVIANCDELFERPEIAAAPDIGWPDCFNSGVFVFVPSIETYQSLLRCAVSSGSFDGGDQGLLNIYFNDWYNLDPSHRLPFYYNMSSSAVYSYTAAYQYFGQQIKIVHFLGSTKPWHHSYDSTCGGLRVHGHPGHAPEHLDFWWSIFTSDVSPLLDSSVQLSISTIFLTTDSFFALYPNGTAKGLHVSYEEDFWIHPIQQSSAARVAPENAEGPENVTPLQQQPSWVPLSSVVVSYTEPDSQPSSSPSGQLAPAVSVLKLLPEQRISFKASVEQISASASEDNALDSVGKHTNGSGLSLDSKSANQRNGILSKDSRFPKSSPIGCVNTAIVSQKPVKTAEPPGLRYPGSSDGRSILRDGVTAQPGFGIKPSEEVARLLQTHTFPGGRHIGSSLESSSLSAKVPSRRSNHVPESNQQAKDTGTPSLAELLTPKAGILKRPQPPSDLGEQKNTDGQSPPGRPRPTESASLGTVGPTGRPASLVSQLRGASTTASAAIAVQKHHAHVRKVPLKLPQSDTGAVGRTQTKRLGTYRGRTAYPYATTGQQVKTASGKEKQSSRYHRRKSPVARKFGTKVRSSSSNGDSKEYVSNGDTGSDSASLRETEQLPTGVASMKLAEVERHPEHTVAAAAPFQATVASHAGGHAPPPQSYDEYAHQRAWEAGVIDYKGRDSFDNIQKRLNETLENGSGPQQPQ